MGKKKESISSLGRHLIKQKQKDLSKHLIKTQRHVLDLNDSQNVKSITETTTLDDFLSSAQMANTEFTAERENIKIIDPNHASDGKHTEEVETSKTSTPLMIPRRPEWDETTTAEELNQLEYEVYLEWRRHLAEVDQNEDIVLTPFEKNIEFWRQLWRVVERSDVCLQILDARNPLIFVCEDLQKYVKQLDENKINVILLNKSDFLTQTQRHIWAKHFDGIGIKALFFSAIQQLETIEDIEESEPIEEYDSIHNSSKLLSRQQLIDVFKSFRSKDSSEPITIGLVGYPNVGKSSTINAILQSKCVSVSATPGKTKHFQTLIVDNELTLCDCPGLVFPNVVSSKAEMIVNGILPIDQLKDPIPPIAVLTERIPRHVFENLYSIVLPKPTEFEDENRSVTAEELLTTYGYSRGFMTQRGLPDSSRSARHILKDFVSGKLLFCYCPPNCDQKLFHKFPQKSNQTNDCISEPLKRILESSQITQKDFDKTYFMSNRSSAHSKGIHGVSGYTRMASDCVRHEGSEADTLSSSDPKPWKKHKNRNKKEKLRRIYAHLDQ